MSVAMLAISIPAVLGSAYYNLQGSLRSVEQTELRNLEQLAESIAGQIAQTISGHKRLAAYLAEQPSMVAALSPKPDHVSLLMVRGRFNSVVSTHPDAELLMLLNTNGDVVNSSDPDLMGRNFKFREYFKEALQGRTFTTNIIVGAVAGNAGVFYANPVKDGTGSVVGVSVLKVKGSSLGDVVERGVRDPNITPFVIDSDGVVIYHPDNAWRYKSLVPLNDETQKRIADDKRFRRDHIEPIGLTALADRAVQARQAGYVRYQTNTPEAPNEHEISGYAPVGNHTWTVIVSERESNFSAPLRKLFDGVGLSMAIVGSLIVVAVLAITRAMSKPIAKLARAARAVEEGDYDYPIQITDSNDEIGHLSRSFKNMMVGVRDREKVKDVFGRMVSPEVREKLLEGTLSLGGETARVSVLFSDIRDFSSISEKMTPQEVVTMLNEYLTEMSIAVKNWGGYINNFIGDAIVVVFGTPIEQPDIETRSVLAALEMRQRLDSLNRRRRASGLEPLRNGIGISTGEVVAGQMGSLDRFLYTVIGDAVNVAARLEALSKDFPEYPILINAETYDKVSMLSGVDLHDLGEQPVKGRERTVHVYGIKPV